MSRKSGDLLRRRQRTFRPRLIHQPQLDRPTHARVGFEKVSMRSTIPGTIARQQISSSPEDLNNAGYSYHLWDCIDSLFISTSSSATLRSPFFPPSFPLSVCLSPLLPRGVADKAVADRNLPIRFYLPHCAPISSPLLSFSLSLSSSLFLIISVYERLYILVQARLKSSLRVARSISTR